MASFEAEYIARNSAAQGAHSAFEELVNLNYEEREAELSNEE